MSSPTPARWATVAEVTEITSVTVTDQQLALANTVIELLVGRTADATAIRERDLRWLKRAVAFQAAWSVDQPDLLTRTETNQQIQDGQHATFRPDSHLLAPLARRALKKLSWKGTRSIYTESTLGGPGRIRMNPGAAAVGGVYDYVGERWRAEL